MNVKSWRFAIALFVGMMTSILASLLIPQVCWGGLIGVFVGAHLARASSPKEGAIVGAVVWLPVGILLIVRQPGILTAAASGLGIIQIALGVCLTSAAAVGMGAFSGLVVGKLFQVTKEQVLIF